MDDRMPVEMERFPKFVSSKSCGKIKLSSLFDE